MEDEIKSVIIIGGGLGGNNPGLLNRLMSDLGLAVAQYLKESNIKVTVYERDVAPYGRSQGYLIGLNEKGIEVVSSLDIPGIEPFLAFNDCGGFTMTDEQLKVLLKVSGSTETCSTALVNRWKLRDLLTQGVNIEWNKKFVRYEEFPDHVVAHFEDGTTAKADILIGADGAKSQVRTQRCPNLKYEYTGVSNVAGFLPIPSDDSLKNVINASLKTLLRVVSKSGISMLVLPFKDENNTNCLLWAISYTSPIEFKYPDDKNELIKIVKEKAKDFHPELQKMVGLTPLDNLLDARKVHSMTAPTEKNPYGKLNRVTMLGNSLHL